MKIKLTKEQRKKMTAVLALLDELRNDKQFMKLHRYCVNEFSGEVTDDMEEDYMRIINFEDDLRDYASNYFGHNG